MFTQHKDPNNKNKYAFKKYCSYCHRSNHSISEIDLVITKVLLLHNTLDHDMILTNVILGLTALHTDPPTDPLIDTTLALDTDHAHILETINLQCIQIPTAHLQDQENLDFLDLVHTPILETKLI